MTIRQEARRYVPPAFLNPQPTITHPHADPHHSQPFLAPIVHQIAPIVSSIKIAKVHMSHLGRTSINKLF
ncbi:MAG: hypothetical protein LBH91_04830 [Prevotellaceae bacterium]|nr:hypothetical protein [Prevotellaceae bacterium]